MIPIEEPQPVVDASLGLVPEVRGQQVDGHTPHRCTE